MDFRERLSIIASIVNGALAVGELGDPHAREVLAELLEREVADLKEAAHDESD